MDKKDIEVFKLKTAIQKCVSNIMDYQCSIYRRQEEIERVKKQKEEDIERLKIQIEHQEKAKKENEEKLKEFTK